MAPRGWVDRAVMALLRSPLSRLLDGSLLVLTVRGRRTGASYSLPVQYAADEVALWVLPGHPETKTWWRNLAAPVRVSLRLRGAEVAGYARAWDGARDPDVVAGGLGVYLARYPRVARRLGAGDGQPDPRQLHELATRTVLVRIVPDDGRVRVTASAEPAG